LEPAQTGPEPVPALTGDILQALATHSRFVQRIRRRYAEHLGALPPGPPERATMTRALQALQADFPALPDRMRVLRQLVLERLAVLDVEQQAPVEVVTHAMTHLAELVLDLACQDAMAQLDAMYGPPLRPDGQRAVFWIIGMGKLGGRELNVSSDIDLIYVYDVAGETTGRPDGGGRISHQDYFSRLVKMLYAMIGETTDHGFVFRVDLALRPNGQSGPPVVSLGALEEYFQVQGREWERFAWLKSRVVAPTDAVARGQALRDVVLPFVFRRYLDYSVFESLRHLHRQIRDHAARRSAGRPERANDVKLSRGGIREIEFIVQLLQVVRGGQFPELSTRATVQALERLVRAQLMSAETALALTQAYVFLRRVEHRIQYLDDQQTHVLPNEDPDLTWMALSLGYGDSSDFLADLNTHRERVALEFDQLLGAQTPVPEGTECKGCRTHPGGDLELLLDHLSPAFAHRVRAWVDNPKVSALREEGRQRLSVLVQRTQSWLDVGRVEQEAALRWMDWVEPLLRRESYLALLVERPKVHEQLLRLLGAARWPARYLLAHPGVIDELASPGLLAERFDAQVFEQELEYRNRSLAEVGQDDEEGLLNLLRRAQHAELFRTLARDVEGRLTVEQVADDLSALADAVLRVSLRWVWARLRQKHREEPRVAVIGYGKLGGKELGYGSDLDIVFVYDDPHEQAGEIYAALVRKLINWLTVKTGEGDLYEIDTALRPNGSSGLLVSSFEAFAQYQTQRGSNTAWTWEHQAMTRARCCVAPADLAQQLEAVRREVISARRGEAPLRAEIIAMRERMRQARPVPEGCFDVKHSPGGMVDAEFVVQHLVLAHSGAYPALLDNVGNIALLHRCVEAGLLPSGVGVAAANAYRDLRRAQHQARLDEKPTQFPAAQWAPQAQAIMTLWRAVWP
jgi:glutamate-ammonia-ligase adenylyltransferase